MSARGSTSYAAFESRMVEQAVPLRALLELTHRCTLACRHCYLDTRNPGRELDTGGWFEVMKRLADAGVLYLTFSGGEFLVRHDHMELAIEARRLGFALRLFTNATLLTADIATRWQQEICPIEVEVSLYGASEDSYRRVTGIARGYGQTLAGLDHLARAGLPTKIKIIALRHNLHELPAMIDLARERANRFQISGRLTPSADGDLGPLKHRITEQDWPEFYARYESIVWPQQDDPERIPCAGGRTSLAIAPGGDVYPCVDLRRPVGNLLTEQLADFWHSDPLLKEIRTLRVGDFRCADSTECARIGVPCMAHNLHATGSLTRIAELPRSVENSSDSGINE